MKFKRIKSAILFLSCILSGCNSDTSESIAPEVTQTITHYNVVIVPDLSNRLKRSAGFPDAGILRALTQNIHPTITNQKRSMQQKDRYSLVLSSKKLGAIYNADFSQMSIDLGSFRNQRERIDYLTGRAAGRTLKSDLTAFNSEFLRIETAAKSQSDGADIWSFLHSGLDKNLAVIHEKTTPDNVLGFQDTFKNILILLTDGYIEAGIFGTKGCEGKQCRYLSEALIKKFRQAYQQRADKQESLSSFFQRNGYGITAVESPYLQDFEVLVLEVDDRSLTVTGNATVEPTDSEIIKLFWEDWMKKSGVRHFEMHPLARDAREAEKNILLFMGIR